ncbi:MAG: DivIVA domain-containing protein [Thermodesulfobacteriota bacterium]
MAISKSDLLTHTFSKKIFGYRPSEVDATLREAAETLGRLSEERAELQRRLGETERDLREYKQREATLRDTLMTTQTIVGDMKEKARMEARELVDGARRQAEAMFEEARNRLAGERARLDALARQRERFEQQMRDLLLAHARLLNFSDESREIDESAVRALADTESGQDAGGDFVFGEETA